MAARGMTPQDIQRSAALVMRENPLGGICGAVCPDRFCMAQCSHKLFDGPINIPAVQATIVQRAKELGGIPDYLKTKKNGKKVAVIGAGAAGLGAAATLAQLGYSVEIFDMEEKPGGANLLIPDFRLDRKVLKTDIDFILSLGDIKLTMKSKIEDPEKLMKKGFAAVVIATGLWSPIMPGIKGQEAALDNVSYLRTPKKFKVKGLSVAVIGGGAVAVDCAVTAKRQGAKRVEMITLEKLSEMPLTRKEMHEIIAEGIEVSGRTRVQEIVTKGKKIVGLKTNKVSLSGAKFSLKGIKDVKGTDQVRAEFDSVIIAIGNRGMFRPNGAKKGIFFAGDAANGPTTVVEGSASGKNTAIQVDAALRGTAAAAAPKIERPTKSYVMLPGYVKTPVSLETDFFGRKLISPFLLSAAPPSDGLEEMRRAYKAGWAGGIMKTCFDNVPIHIPGEYMHVFNEDTYGNCDNVSGHPMDRVVKEVRTLIKEFPDRLTMASTGGPVTGNDEADKRGWQANTKKLESAGVMGIEYSLSCPQGGDGTEGDIVSQNAALTAKIIDWVMEVSDPEIPKLFKLTSAVTSIYPIAKAIKDVFAKYPKKKAGITLANTFPSMDFRKIEKKEWEEGIVFGMSGEGVLPISYLTLAMVAPVGLTVSGNGGVMTYKHAADFLALGTNSVQVCTVATKYGYGIIDELENGLSYLLQKRGIRSIADLKGIALPNPIRGFMELTPKKKISEFNYEICVQCGNCSRCPYLAITMTGKDGRPVTDPSLCIGCSICSKKCFTGAIYMRERTKKELAQLKED
jgi:NADPH-dependent glutamate synthase beta subunit-like oxidoreductase/dihydroorotate dehydrogenase/Pyruvate/2-oxoacid:ferredoxin oxidoreductase delta subunit